RPYAFLDDAPLEERRTQAVMARRWLTPEQADELGQLDPEAIERVKAEVWPDAANADELHDALVWLGFLTDAEVEANAGWRDWLADLGNQKRAARIVRDGPAVWIAAERLSLFRALCPDLSTEPSIEAPKSVAKPASSDAALVELLRGRLEGLGPVTMAALAAPLGLDITIGLATLEAEGFAMRGRFSAGAVEDEWCERRLLARIHRYTIKRLRASGATSCASFSAGSMSRPRRAWRARRRSRPSSSSSKASARRRRRGRARSCQPASPTMRRTGSTRAASPGTLSPRRHVALWRSLLPAEDAKPSAKARAVLEFMTVNGASFFDELVQHCGLLRTHVEEALAELVSLGLVTSDSFAGLRTLLVPASERRPGGRRRRRAVHGMEESGRWSPVRPSSSDAAAIEHV